MRIERIALPAAALLLSMLCAGGCEGATPSIDTSASAGEMSFDGLYPVKNSFADAAWARPGADISKYSKIMLEGVGVEYRPGGASGRLYHGRARADYYEITEAQKDRFEKLLAEKFREELAKSEHFTIVDAAGPDVLLIRGGLLDVVSYAPPPTAGRYEILLDRVAEATLVLEIRDSVSEAIIARAVDRRAAESISGGHRRSNRATNTAEVRRLIATWAGRLREVLDSYGPPE